MRTDGTSNAGSLTEVTFPPSSVRSTFAVEPSEF